MTRRAVYRVVLDPRHRWRWDETARRYVEDADDRASPSGDVTTWYAAVAEALAVRSPEAAVRFPPRCPHCGGVTTTTRKLLASRDEHRGPMVELVVPSCDRMPRPLPAYFLQLVLAFVSVAAMFAILATPYAAIVMLASLAANVALWRARTWLHLPDQHGDLVVLEARDAAWAHGLARLNHGRVEGRGPVPELPTGDEHRAPLPEARIQK